MGEQKVSIVKDQSQMRKFMRLLLNDVKAIEFMLENDWFESDVTRIGAEQELCLVDAKTFKPAPLDDGGLDKVVDAFDWLETELARFNLETNLTPRVFEGSCLRLLEEETADNLDQIRKMLNGFGISTILTGILPTLRQSDLNFHNLTPKKRYFALMEAIKEHLGERAFNLHLKGIDELKISHDSPLLEACNTSFQVHLQIAPKEFVCMYNIAQAIAAPVMAIAANSPLVFGKRLWHESRIAMFQGSLDTRRFGERESKPRVNFGTGWLERSILEIYKEDIARFRVLLAGDEEENSLDLIKEGKVPKLRSLQVHNSTVYRWNRPCYGISGNGKPHLRIENRVLPSGPTIVDEVANAAFWLGAMKGMASECQDITKRLMWEDVGDNFIKSARFGIDSKFNWFDEKKVNACDLILSELLPLARLGLEKQKVDKTDIDKYLGIIEERAKRHANGARWQLRAFTNLKKTVSIDEAVSVMTASIIKNQGKGIPVHAWELPELSDLKEYRPSKLRVDEFMVADLFTVRREDIIEIVAGIMDWRKIRHLPVEDKKGNLVGLITSRLLLHYYSQRDSFNGGETTLVKDIMINNPITVQPGTTIVNAMRIMRDKKIGCLPVVIENGEDKKEKKLVGIITVMDFLRISGSLIERMEREK